MTYVEPLPTGVAHIAALQRALDALDGDVARIERWGSTIAERLVAGGRLLAVGNGGSAAQAQHLTSELVGRYRDDRPPFSAIALHADTSALTALVNDYPVEDMFGRQVRAHGRPLDVLVAMSTSGRSPNVVAAAEVARERGLIAFALTGPAPNPLQLCCDDAVPVEAAATATVQEVHQVLIHLLCGAIDVAVGASDPVKDWT
jgi:D-sedoheptulose 7-phosphate isomerase